MMLTAIYPTVKYHSPQAQVVFGGIAYDFTETGGPFVRSFLDDVLNAGAGEYFDIFNFHTYPAFADNWLPPTNSNQGSGLYEKAQHLRQKLAGHGLNKPIIITEAGWRSNSTATSVGSGNSGTLRSSIIHPKSGSALGHRDWSMLAIPVRPKVTMDWLHETTLPIESCSSPPIKPSSTS